MKTNQKTLGKRAKEGAAKRPKPLQKESSLHEAGEQMRRLGTERYPVAAGDRLVGTVEGKFPDRKAAGYGHDPSTTLVGDHMSRKKYFCHANQSIEEARDIMRENGLQHLPVVDDDLHIIGIVAFEELRMPAADG
ncbi:MAG: CBS domain-containing protein [Terrimicrobiaceae bacterium]|nr:CBS domain-containing protein [Terrimicrobiaceae bacterium]